MNYILYDNSYLTYKLNMIISLVFKCLKDSHDMCTYYDYYLIDKLYVFVT